MKDKIRCIPALLLALTITLSSCGSDAAGNDTGTSGETVSDTETISENETQNTQDETDDVSSTGDASADAVLDGMWVCRQTLGEAMENTDYAGMTVDLGVEGLYDEIDESIELDTYLYFHDTGVYECLIEAEQYDAFVDEMMNCLKTYLEGCAADNSMTLDEFLDEAYAMEWSQFVDYTRTVSFSYESSEVDGVEMIYTQSGTYTYDGGVLTTSEELFSDAGLSLECEIDGDLMTLLSGDTFEEFEKIS